MGFTRNRFVENRFPELLHVRVDADTKKWAQSRGGSYYVRQLIQKDKPQFDPDTAPATPAEPAKPAKKTKRKKHKKAAHKG